MKILQSFLEQSISVKQAIQKDEHFGAAFEQATQVLLKVREQGGTIFSAGNGGSACDAMHLSEELTARYKRERSGIKAIHFLDAAAMSCWSNDYSYTDYFKRQVETFCTPDDCFIAISTSGNSANLIEAVRCCKQLQVPTIGLLGKDGGALAELVDTPLVVPSSETDRIQEVHILLIHAFCEALEQ